MSSDINKYRTGQKDLLGISYMRTPYHSGLKPALVIYAKHLSSPLIHFLWYR